jgi:hypothetical protein
MDDSQENFINYLVLAYNVYCTTPRNTSLVLELLQHPLTHNLRAMYTVSPIRSSDLSGQEDESGTPRGQMDTELSCARDLETSSQRSLVLYSLSTSDPHNGAPENEQYAFQVIRNLYRQLARRTHPDRCVGRGDGGALFAIVSEFHRKRELAGMIYCALGLGIDVWIELTRVHERLRSDLRRLIHYIEDDLA